MGGWGLLVISLRKKTPVIRTAPLPGISPGPPPSGKPERDLSNWEVPCYWCPNVATRKSPVSGRWLCSACIPCYCDYCQGRPGMHNEDARELYKSKIRALQMREEEKKEK